MYLELSFDVIVTSFCTGDCVVPGNFPTNYIVFKYVDN